MTNLVRYNKPVSWSRFLVGEECPLRLRIQLTKDPAYPITKVSFDATKKGLIVQTVFEHFFKRDLGRLGKDKEKILLLILDKYLQSEEAKKYGDVSSYEEDMRSMIKTGFAALAEMGILDYKVESEGSYIASYSGLRLFGKLDFVVWKNSREVILIDGKGHRLMEADERQIKFYTLILLGRGLKVSKAGFLYWRHGWKEIDVTPKSLLNYTRDSFNKTKELFISLQTGVEAESMEANPSKKNCLYCEFKLNCKEAYGIKEKLVFDDTDLLFETV